MIKRKVVETVEEYDASGKLTRKVTTETTEDDDSPQKGYVTYPVVEQVPWWIQYPNIPQVTYGNDKTEQVPWWVSHPWQITCNNQPGSCDAGSVSGATSGTSSNFATWEKGNSTPTT